MRYHDQQLNVPAGAAPSTGTAAIVADLVDKTVHIGGTITAGNVAIQVSIDGTNWSTSQTVGAPGVYTVPETARYMRIAKLAGMTGAPTAHLGARLARSV